MTIHYDISSRSGFKENSDSVDLGVQAVCGSPVSVNPLCFGVVEQKSPSASMGDRVYLGPCQTSKVSVAINPYNYAHL
jgi:hypothetical protein